MSLLPAVFCTRKQPGIRVVYHFDDPTEDYFVVTIQFSSLFHLQIFVMYCEFQPDLSLCSFAFNVIELGQKRDSYRRFRHASARFPQTERDDLRT